MIEPLVWVPMPSGTCRSATAAAEPERRTARRARRIVRIARRAGVTVAEFGGHGLAEDKTAGLADHRGAGRIGHRNVAGIDRRVEAGRHARDVDDVLDADGNAMQRSGRLLRIGFPCLRHRLVRIEMRPGHHRIVAFGDPLEAARNQFLRREFALRDRRGRLDGGEIGGTRYRQRSLCSWSSFPHRAARTRSAQAENVRCRSSS